MLRNRTARQKNFTISPSADVPRSKLKMRQTRKQAFNASELVPIMLEQVLPGDVWQHKENIMARLATPIAPLIDDLDLETFYFYIPNRIIWKFLASPPGNWEDFITGTDDTLTVPTVRPVVDGVGYQVKLNGVFDHMGILPQNGSITEPEQWKFNALPIFAYFTVYNEWFRDQNLQEPFIWSDTWNNEYSSNINQDSVTWNQECVRANKRHDYFTSSLPWPQKGDAVTLPLGTTAPVIPDGTHAVPTFWNSTANSNAGAIGRQSALANAPVSIANTSSVAGETLGWNDPNLVADLSSATAATIAAIRLAFQTQKLLERDARGGSRYVEQLMSHFGVRSPDYRLQRPEYLGGSKISVTVNPIAQTAPALPDAGSELALGNLAAEMHASGSKRTFTYAATEHGWILGLALVRATPTYQQGTRRHWLQRTRLDYYFPAFAMLGEQAVQTREIFQRTGTTPYTNDTWGYQERWAELRYTPNEITGVLRSTAAQPMDWWHLSEEFSTEPALNAAFITDKTQEVLARCLAADPENVWSAQIIMDILHDNTVARLLPTYSVPGLIDHF